MSNHEVNFAVARDSEMVQLGVNIQNHTHQDLPPPYTITDPINNQPPVTGQPVVHQTIYVQQTLKNSPIYTNCPSCHKSTLTTVQFVNSKKTHMLAGFICGLTTWCMLCCLATIPYAFSTFKTADHYCSNCNYYLGSYSKL
ncbi:lipopolysaccharide-induced tumor necrosis factor-alpha factor homolog [Bicyclus anynana]|uniref:Lipopolysaccharide-induced tumor necrosis factor-alpha factor homolog n=1 Tax=Bicyclus anynana TaxID=110368 RepID=A0ABM3LYD0_BICAN|nr:lipopolysaccharide-induced tumor necrosis factor-alpha factor homolog [Bicyclus anynana]